MSLWNVDDQLAGAFMTDFFKQLSITNGRDKHAAFRHAQEVTRTQFADSASYDDWATFILLDGVD